MDCNAMTMNDGECKMGNGHVTLKIEAIVLMRVFSFCCMVKIEDQISLKRQTQESIKSVIGEVS